ncbi:MAG: hypothetical protein NC336_09880 [Clostridium sp.]|nr:hypothetical protein [Clostridium sp.]
MNPLYNAALGLYSAGVSLAAARNPKAAKMVAGQKETLARLREVFGPEDRPVWIHAASLGEFEQGRPLIERFRREHPEQKILLTFFSPSGYEVRKNYPLADCVCYLPFDTPGRVRAFLDAARPSITVFVKYEFWGNYLEELSRRGIPSYLISAIFRPGQIFFCPWGRMFRQMLRRFRTIFVQDRNSVELLARIGVDNVVQAGDTRFDRVVDIRNSAPDLSCLDPFLASGTELTLVAGSSWPPDENIYIPWAKGRGDVRLIIAPHEFDEQRLRQIESRIDGPTVRFSELERNPGAGAGAKCVLVDCFGKLSAIYRYGDIAWVGGGFGVSIHNINEAAVYGIPVIYGPNNRKFKEAADLRDCGGGFPVANRQEGIAILDRLADDPAARLEAGRSAGAYISGSVGATPLIYDTIFRK